MGNQQTAESPEKTPESPEQTEDSPEQPTTDGTFWTMVDLEKYIRKKGLDTLIVIIHGKVYDVTEFKDEHPGGPEILQGYHLKDASDEFEEIGHTRGAIEMMDDYLLGYFKK